MRACKVCRTQYTPTKPMQTVCGHECAMSLAVSKRAKAAKVALVKDKRDTKAKLEKLKTKAQWASEAQTAVNSFIRARDEGQPCISCGRQHQGQWHAGHYLSRGAHPELRFHEWNIHKQCSPCNTHLSGNAVLYRQGLIVKIGIAQVEWLEGPHNFQRQTVEELRALKAIYQQKLRELKAAQA